jgi:hypothetical protein
MTLPVGPLISGAVALPEHFTELLDGLPRDWSVARVDVTVGDPAEADRAALILAPSTPGRTGSTFHLHVSGGGESPGVPSDRARRVLARLDEAGIRARLKVGSYDTGEPAAAPAPEKVGGRKTLAATWDELVAKLPADWSDLYLELELDSTDFLERGALLLAPVNPTTFGVGVGVRFRCAHRFGYGAAPQMARRCLARLDEEGITGTLSVVRVLSDTKPVATQGPVWRLGGRAV